MLAFAACASASSENDAATGSVDGAAVIDAAPGTPDAANDPTDASTSVADAAVIDAAPGTPDAAIPDASIPDASAPDANGCTGGWTQLLSNPGFDLGATVWTTTTDVPAQQVIRMYGAGYPWPAQAGDWAAVFGGDDYTIQTMYQNFTVPANATMLRVAGYTCFVSSEITTVTEYDTIDIELQTTAGATLENVAHWSNLTAGTTCSWAAASLDATTSYAGQTIRLHFASETDVSNITSFGFDSLAVEAFVVCP